MNNKVFDATKLLNRHYLSNAQTDISNIRIETLLFGEPVNTESLYAICCNV